MQSPSATEQTKLVIVKMSGRLGNQLFQYFSGRSLANRLSAELKVYFQNTDRWEISEILKVEAASDDVLAGVIGNTGFLGKVNRNLQFFLKPEKRFLYKEKSQNFQPDFNCLSCSVFLDGYWQSFRYFSHVTPADYEKVRSGIASASKADSYIVEAQHSVVVHVRRTDAVAQYGELGIDYYQKAMELFPDNTRYLVISDDITYCKELFGQRKNIIYVEGVNRTAVMDLNLMIQAQGVVMGNSTFSWWGAFLNTALVKQVIAPQKWHVREKGKIPRLEDIYPPTWRIL